MGSIRMLIGAAIAALVLTACGSNTSSAVPSTSTAHGTLIVNPPLRLASLSAAALQAELSSSASGAALLEVAGAPACGIDVYYVLFQTLGAAGEQTESSGAMMVPTGPAGTCSGSRPIVLYAHGTNTDKTLNLADLTNPNNGEGVLIAAMFAAQGFIVVAPNYAGYDISTLGYHPYLLANQQSGEMLDILAAARSGLPKSLSSSTTDSGQLLVTGYSEGGYVAMATARALDMAGTPATAYGPMSGPYALEAFGDAIFDGFTDIGGTIFAPFLTTAYQKAYGNIYTSTSDIYAPAYASGIDTLLPSANLGANGTSALFLSGALPETALFALPTPTAADVMAAAPMFPAPAALAAGLQYPTTATVPAQLQPFLPVFDAGFGPCPNPNPGPPAACTAPYQAASLQTNLLNNTFRIAYAADAALAPDGAFPSQQPGLGVSSGPTQTFRLALYTNDLRNGGWIPEAPLLMCGGQSDPTVFFWDNTQVMQGYWAEMGLPAGLINVENVDLLGQMPAAGDPYALIELGFEQAEAQVSAAAGGGAAGQAAVTEAYHGTLVPPFCAAAVRGFFQTVLAGG